MRDLAPSKIAFLLCSVLGICLLVARWIYHGELAGFFVTLILLIMFLLRWRVPRLRYSSLADVAVCLVLSPAVVALPLFWAMYHRVYVAAVAVVYVFFVEGEIALAVLGALAGVFLGLWEKEHERRLKTRDTQAGRFYELENLQQELRYAAERIERMTQLSERARIAREIHDNAGHEIVAAYITLQAVREGVREECGGARLDSDSLALFDAALERLEHGTQRIRDAVHNLAPVIALGADTLRERCERFPGVGVEFVLHGDTTRVSVHIWNVLEAVLNEALTNAARHARPTYVRVTLDATPRLVRMCVENDGSAARTPRMGTGLRNLRYRAASVGGSLVVDPGEIFKLICVVPLEE